ncbi:hypothetical protein V5N11_008297 [Cardamine amara subsp. amara]|uniref:Myb/SANT-like domain-containing protein n=1 Tax=Cardamine amara subsp. amara TaxID=228776 RepID=A0ABD0ZXF9_CARAN
MGDSQQDRGKGQYIQWSPQESKTLINLLLDGVAQGWRDVNGVFSKFTVERRILPALNQTQGFSSGFGWDPNTKRFTASNEVWDNYFMVNFIMH